MGCLYSTNLSELVVGLNTDLPSQNENIVISNTEGAQAEGFRDSLGLMAINHANAISDRDNINSTRIELVPHVHTLFCERKQRSTSNLLLFRLSANILVNLAFLLMWT